MRITLVISSLNGGGAERVMSILANYWAQSGQDVVLITHSAGQDAYAVSDHVRRVRLVLEWNSLHLGDALRNNANRIRTLRRIIRESRPDIVISFVDTTNILTLSSCLGCRFPVIVSERTDPRQHRIGRIWTMLRRLLYPYAAAVVVQTPSVRQWALTFLPSKAVHTIPNPILPSSVKRNFERVGEGGKRTVVAMGRLTIEKGHDLLIRAAALVLEKHPAWTLMILGDGLERQNLEKLAADLGVSHQICFQGHIKEPNALLYQADLFVLPSRFEGFPNALLEAMVCGLPVISADCPSGPREIIRDGVDGVLVPPEDVDALAAAMDRLMSDKDERNRLAHRAPEVLNRFGIEQVMGMWEDLLQQVSGPIAASIKQGSR